MIDGQAKTGFEAKHIHCEPYAAAAEADASGSTLTKQRSAIDPEPRQPRMRKPWTIFKT